MKKITLHLLFYFNHLSNFRIKEEPVLKPLLLILFLLVGGDLFAQKDAIIKTDSTEIRCNILKENQTKYTYAYINSGNKVVKASILKTVVSTIKYDKYEANLVANKLFDPEPVPEGEEPVKSYQYTFGIGLNVSNVL